MNPSTYGCDECKVSYPMGAETRVYIYTRQPWFNHLSTICPNCGQNHQVWQLTDGAIAYLEANNMVSGDEVEWSVKEFATRPVVVAFCAATGLPLDVPHPLSKRQKRAIDRQCGFFAYLLETEVWPYAG